MRPFVLSFPFRSMFCLRDVGQRDRNLRHSHSRRHSRYVSLIQLKITIKIKISHFCKGPSERPFAPLLRASLPLSTTTHSTTSQTSPLSTSTTDVKSTRIHTSKSRADQQHTVEKSSHPTVICPLRSRTSSPSVRAKHRRRPRQRHLLLLPLLLLPLPATESCRIHCMAACVACSDREMRLRLLLGISTDTA